MIVDNSEGNISNIIKIDDDISSHENNGTRFVRIC